MKIQLEIALWMLVGEFSLIASVYGMAGAIQFDLDKAFLIGFIGLTSFMRLGFLIAKVGLEGNI